MKPALAWCALGVVMGLGPLAAWAGEEQYQYVGVGRCRRCHKKPELGNQYGQWRKLKHAKAYKDLSSKNPKAVATAKKMGVTGNPREADACLKCHVTGHGEDKSRFAEEFDVRGGVQCESCHGPGSGYTRESIMKDCAKAENLGLIAKPKEELCVKCHNKDNPNWDPDRYTTKDGKKVGFDYEQAKEKTKHPRPEKGTK